MNYTVSCEHVVAVSALETQTLCVVTAYDTENRRLRSLLFSGNKRDRTETSTQCTEWSQFAIDYFFPLI